MEAVSAVVLQEEVEHPVVGKQSVIPYGNEGSNLEKGKKP